MVLTVILPDCNRHPAGLQPSSCRTTTVILPKAGPSFCSFLHHPVCSFPCHPAEGRISVVVCVRLDGDHGRLPGIL